MVDHMLIAEVGFMLYLIPVAGAIAIAAVIWVVLDHFYGNKTRADERLAELGQDPRKVAAKRAAAGSALAPVKDMLGKASPTLSKSLTPKTAKEAGALKMRLSHAGFRTDEATPIFLTLKVIGGITGALIGGVVFLILGGFTLGTLIRTLIAGGVMFFAADIVLWFLTKKRKEGIFLGLPDALDLMVVCVEAGLGLDQAMRKVADEMHKTRPILAYEFGICNMQLQMGRPRVEVLNELGSRNGVDDLKALASIIIQADKFGSSIAHALRVQSEAMRTRRRQIAEEKAAKTAVQLIFPLVLFIFPGIFVVLVGPAAITMVNEMLPMMAGGK